MKYEPVQTTEFTEAKRIVQQRIEETESDTGAKELTADVKLEIAIHTLGQFTRRELAEAAEVNYSKAQTRVEIWESLDVLTCVGVKDHDLEGRDPEIFALTKMI